MNESPSKLTYQGRYASGTTAVVRDSIINGINEDKTKKKDRPIKVLNFCWSYSGRYGALSYSNNPEET